MMLINLPLSSAHQAAEVAAQATKYYLNVLRFRMASNHVFVAEVRGGTSTAQRGIMALAEFYGTHVYAVDASRPDSRPSYHPADGVNKDWVMRVFEEHPVHAAICSETDTPCTTCPTANVPCEAAKPDPFADVRNKRMGELNGEQYDRAMELWLRQQIDSFQESQRKHLGSLLRVIDRLRTSTDLAQAEAPSPAPGSWAELQTHIVESRGRATPPTASPVRELHRVPDGVWEALQRMIEDGFNKGPGSQDDARTVARWRAQFVPAREGAALATQPQETQPCGHPASLLLTSAETGEPLYCEACDDKSGRRDAEVRESELMAANQALRTELAVLKSLTVRRAEITSEEWEWLKHPQSANDLVDFVYEFAARNAAAQPEQVAQDRYTLNAVQREEVLDVLRNTHGIDGDLEEMLDCTLEAILAARTRGEKGGV